MQAGYPRDRVKGSRRAFAADGDASGGNEGSRVTSFPRRYDHCRGGPAGGQKGFAIVLPLISAVQAACARSKETGAGVIAVWLLGQFV